MIHLQAIISNTHNYESKLKPHVQKVPKAPPVRRAAERLSCKVGGYWFWLTINMWVPHTDFTYAKIAARHRNLGKSVGQSLGFESTNYGEH